MAHFDLHCRDCGNAFPVTTRGAITPRQKKCPKCGSTSLRQTFSSYLRNGSLTAPDCGAPTSSGYG